MSREALWLAIHEANTVEAWMQLTNEFNLYRIYTLFRILNDPKQCETLRCRTLKWFTLSLEAYDKHDASPQCYMALNDGNVRECYTPASFSSLMSDVMQSAMRDGAMEDSSAEDVSEEAEEKGEKRDAIPTRLQYSAFEALLTHFNAGPAVNDRSKIIKLFCAMTGRSFRTTKNLAYEGCTLSPLYQSRIDDINNAFFDMNIHIQLKSSKKS